jgi:hypothetical protein
MGDGLASGYRTATPEIPLEWPLFRLHLCRSSAPKLAEHWAPMVDRGQMSLRLQVAPPTKRQIRCPLRLLSAAQPRQMLPGAFESEPHDRLERSSPGYGPGASPSTLAGQRAAEIPLDLRRLADVRYAVCQRVRLRRPPREEDGFSGRRRSRPVAGVGIEPTWYRLMRPGRAQPSLHDISEPSPFPLPQAREGEMLRVAEGLNLAVRFWRPD